MKVTETTDLVFETESGARYWVADEVEWDEDTN